MPNEITELINHRINRLKKRIEAAPKSGETEDVRQFLAVIEATITAFRTLLDDIDAWKSPE
jgi:hypothetical protein